MRGSIRSQCGYLSTFINELGKSKYAAKEVARHTLLVNGRNTTSENVAKQIGVFAASSLSNYVERWIELGSFAREELEIKDMAKLDGDAVRSFLEDKLERGISYSHFSGYVAAFTKLENALEQHNVKINSTDRDYNFKEATRDVRAEAKLELPRFEGTRSYASPEQLIGNLSGTSNLVAHIQLESGARLAEASHIEAGQLRGITHDPHTGKVIGQFEFIGKGGKVNIGNLSPGTYQQLAHHIEQHGALHHSADTYRNNLQSAAPATNQDYNGSHGLRWSFAQNRMAELEHSGMGYREALGTVASEMGHNRIDITEHYLGR